jgi:large subunit ribosomal protein L1
MQRSKRYQELVKKIDKKKICNIAEAVIAVKSTAVTKFDSSVEVHMRLGIDTAKGEQIVRGAIALPHGTGKNLRVAVFTKKEEAAKKAGADIVGSEELIQTIKTTSKIDFDIALASPEMMKLLAPIAKILGPKGLMPSPKSETVIPDEKMSAAVSAIKKGKASFKNDDTGNIHQIIGKVSWPDEHLISNFETLINAVIKAKPTGVKGDYIKAVYLTSTMGPSVKINI